MSLRLTRWISSLNSPSYVIFFVTARCNATCQMCFYMDSMNSNKAKTELTVDEYRKITTNLKPFNILGISGGEPFLRNDLSEIIKVTYDNCRPLVVDLPTHGFFTDSILRQVEDIAQHCRNMTVDVQLSFDGPEEVHNRIRGLKDGFRRLTETYKGLARLKQRYKNLRVKACVVYSHYNQDYIEDLFGILDRDFKELDRIIFSIVHGTAYQLEAKSVDYNRYFKICQKIQEEATVRNIFDWHTVFTMALRIVKNDYLKDVLKNKDFYKQCGAGKRVLVINEQGKIFPCEPLWHSIGNLKEFDYDVNRLLKSKSMQSFQKKIACEQCTCDWGLPMSTALIYSPRYYPRIVSEMARIIWRSLHQKVKYEKTFVDINEKEKELDVCHLN